MANLFDSVDIYIENIAIADNFCNYSEKLNEADLRPWISEGNGKTSSNIVITGGDSLKVALFASGGITDNIKGGSHPVRDVVVLNFANGNVAGGGYRIKGTTQEEILLKRTTLGATLRPEMYPLDVYEDRFRYYHYKSLGLIYSPEVWILRNKGFDLMEQPFRISTITCAAINNPRTNSGKYVYESDRDITRRKIRMILATAHKYKKQVLVAGMWGCGAFGNPLEICQIWRDEASNYPTLQVVFPVMGESADEFSEALWRGQTGEN